MSERQRLNDLINPKLMAVYIAYNSLTIPQPDKVGLNYETAENFPTYIATLQELADILRRLDQAGVKNIQCLRMAEYIDLQSNDEFFVGHGRLLWVEMGEEIPFSLHMGVNNQD